MDGKRHGHPQFEFVELHDGTDDPSRQWRHLQRHGDQLRRQPDEQHRDAHREHCRSLLRNGCDHLQERPRAHRPEPHGDVAHHRKRQFHQLWPQAHAVRDRQGGRAAPLPFAVELQRHNAQRGVRGHRTRSGLRLRLRQRRHALESFRSARRRSRWRRPWLRPGLARSRHHRHAGHRSQRGDARHYFCCGHDQRRQQSIPRADPRARCRHRRRTAGRSRGSAGHLSHRRRHHHLRPAPVQGAARPAAAERNRVHHVVLPLR